MNHLFVPYELAVKAKEHGFDEPCFGWWWDDNSSKVVHLTPQMTQLELTFSAPLYQQLVDWFEEKHEIIILPYKETPLRRKRNGMFEPIYAWRLLSKKAKEERIIKALEAAFMIITNQQ